MVVCLAMRAFVLRIERVVAEIDAVGGKVAIRRRGGDVAVRSRADDRAAFWD